MRVWGLYVRYRTKRPAPPREEDVPVRKGRRLVLRPGVVYYCRICHWMHNDVEAIAYKHEAYVEVMEGIRPRMAGACPHAATKALCGVVGCGG